MHNHIIDHRLIQLLPCKMHVVSGRIISSIVQIETEPIWEDTQGNNK
jgi:hypothetical protein